MTLPRVAGMATMPSRIETAPLVLASILPQVSRLWLFLDRFESVPAYAGHEKINVVRSQDVGDLRSNGQLIGLALDEEPCTFFPVGDDIDYPHDYCETLQTHLDRLSDKAAVGVHAGVLRPPPASYGRDTKFLHYRSEQRRTQGVDILGTGTLAFKTSTLRFDVREWSDVNMVDLLFARTARERFVPLVMIPRRAHWIRALGENQDDSIWAGVLRDDSRQSALAQELVELPRPPLPRGRWQRRLSYRSV